MKEYGIVDIEELKEIAKDVVEILGKRKDVGCASVLALHGNLGAGKTTFMQILATELGISETVTSPTFVIMKKYETSHEVFKQLVHIDAYRIEDIDEMRPLRFDEELAQKDTMIGIEWAEKIEALLPNHTIHMYFTIEGETRTISISDEKEN